MTQMVYDSELCDIEFIMEALDTIGNLNNIALDLVHLSTYCKMQPMYKPNITFNYIMKVILGR